MSCYLRVVDVVAVAGLQAEQGVHHYPESFARHRQGLLEDDLGAQRARHRGAAGTRVCSGHT